MSSPPNINLFLVSISKLGDVGEWGGRGVSISPPMPYTNEPMSCSSFQVGLGVILP